jgi:hypothetical protein
MPDIRLVLWLANSGHWKKVKGIFSMMTTNITRWTMKWLRYQRVISLKIQVGNTNQRNKWSNTDPGYTGGGIRCLGTISIPCWSITPAVSPVPWSWLRSYPLSKLVCLVRSNYWYEKFQTTYVSMKVCTYKLDHCNDHRTCETLTLNETIEIPVTSTCLSVVYFDSKTDRM